MILVALTFLFFLFKLMPGSFSDVMMYRGASPEMVAEFEEKWGLNDPLHIQYFNYVKNLLQGDAGVSLQFRIPVFEFVKLRIFNTFIVVAPGITMGYTLGGIYGLYLGMRRGSWIEKNGLIPIIFIGSFPSFFLAIVMVVVFAGWFDLFPTGGTLSTETRRFFGRDAPWWRTYLTADFAWHYFLPFATVVLRYLRTPTLIMRTSSVEVMGQGFHYYQRVTGLPSRVRFKNMMKHSMLPLITLYPVSMTRAIGGLVLIEIVFNWPGIGFTLVRAVLFRDIPVIMFVFFVMATFIIVANYIVDIVYGMIDPRVQVGEDYN
jgi:peptide/nickel transport system permease protein